MEQDTAHPQPGNACTGLVRRGSTSRRHPQLPGRRFTCPWIVCDYPLAQAVEDRIVKAPMILHLVNKADPEKVTRDSVIQKYGDWLVAGVNRLKAHTKAFKDIPGTKPVMFVMCESVQHADKIGDWLKDSSSPFKLKDDEVLVIHTDREGKIKESDSDELRRQAGHRRPR